METLQKLPVELPVCVEGSLDFVKQMISMLQQKSLCDFIL